MHSLPLPRLALLLWLLLPGLSNGFAQAQAQEASLAPQLGPPGRTLRYEIENSPSPAVSVVRTLQLHLGPVTSIEDRPHQWLHQELIKGDGKILGVWWLLENLPSARQPRPSVARYLVQEPGSQVTEYLHPESRRAVPPSLVEWRHLLPRPLPEVEGGFGGTTPPASITFLGHSYGLTSNTSGTPSVPPEPNQIRRLRPDLMIGLPSNRRQKDETRRYDTSDYEYQRLDRADYQRMVEAGFTCLRIDLQQLPDVLDLDAFHWGVEPADLPFPESLYRSSYLGPALFLDEPAVTTRDSLIRPRFTRDPAFRTAITPQAAFASLREHFEHVLQETAPVHWRRNLAQRKDVDLGSIQWPQANLYTWETMIATGGYQLSRDPVAPAAIVFEPPGRIGSRRTLPEWNMSYGCQLRTDAPANFASVIFGFLRGAARATGKEWGTSIYGALDRADGPWLFTHAYDLGATRFFFWDNYQLACVPFGESLSITRHLRNHAANHPRRDLERLRRAAEVALVLPPGYNLGHVQMGKGSLWGIGELNLERTNSFGIPYRTVMGHLFSEIERCLRQGTDFDLLWDLPEFTPSGYREVVRVLENGTLEIARGQERRVLTAPRPLDRPEGPAPELLISLASEKGPAPFRLDASASVIETSAPVFYTTGADPAGVYHNARVGWDLFGPGAEDYRPLYPPDHRPSIHQLGNAAVVRMTTRLDNPGTYRLRAAVSDLAGRTAVRWVTFEVQP